MRDIRFRAWDGANMVGACCVVDSYFQLQGGRSYGNFMQFTGLLDKNGKEIYEGDIVESDKNCLCNVGRQAEQVKFCNGMFMIRNISLNVLRDFNPEVIGNIHENPELLEELS